MITTQDVGQEGSRKAGELRGLGLTVAKARAIWGPIVGYRNSGRIGAILGGTCAEGQGARYPPACPHNCKWAGRSGPGPAQPDGVMPGLLSGSPSQVL